MRRLSSRMAVAMAAWIAMHALASAAPKVTLQPAGQGPDNRSAGVTVNDPARDPPLTAAQLTRLLREKIKYVFVIFNENHAFDNEYGTYPGVNGLYADAQGQTITVNDWEYGDSTCGSDHNSPSLLTTLTRQ